MRFRSYLKVPETGVSNTTGGKKMNRDQVKGRMKEAGGKAQYKAGKAAGSLKHQAKGALRTAAGKLQKNAGDAASQARGEARRSTREP